MDGPACDHRGGRDPAVWIGRSLPRGLAARLRAGGAGYCRDIVDMECRARGIGDEYGAARKLGYGGARSSAPVIREHGGAMTRLLLAPRKVSFRVQRRGRQTSIDLHLCGGDAARGRALQPEVITAQVVVAGAARYAHALFDAVEEFVLPQLLSHLAVQGVHAIDQAVEFVEQFPQARAVDARRVFVRGERAHLPLEFFHYLGLEVGAIEEGEDVEQAHERIAAVPHRRAFDVGEEFVEKMFQPQKGASPFVERLFVSNVLLHDPLYELGCSDDALDPV